VNENRVLPPVCPFTRPTVLETPMAQCSCPCASQRGQGMLEYALIVFFIVVVAIVGIVFLVPVILQGLSGALPAL
jgi:hypothetical protein